MSLPTTSDSLEILRNMLLALKPSGPDGFEGLIATTLSAQTGLVIRLAKSGIQFGRDASSGPDPYAVAMEAKRYDENLRLETLAGKAVVGGHALTGKIDLWILGASTEVGDETVLQISEILDDYGVSLLVLDWTPRPLPPLAVLLASARAATLAWFAAHESHVDSAVLESALDSVAAHPNFQEQAERLRRSLTASEIGLDALRQKMKDWLEQRFSNRDISQRTFGQFITVADPSAPALPRMDAAKSLAEKMVVDKDKPAAVVLLGEEGVGKTWLVAQWWAALTEPPILVFVAGRRVEHLDPSRPLESLAKLLAEVDENYREREVAGWLRRLRRWRNQDASGQLRFIIVLDGLNEHPGRPWADILKSLVSEVHALGGLVVATTREAFWQREISPRIRNSSITTRTVVLQGYTDEDLATILSRAGIEPTRLSPQVRAFVRNPRVCTVALNLLDRLSLQPNELTLDRLLLEYWHWRLEERGDLIGHNIQDFEKVLRSHAQAWLSRPDRLFDRDQWSSHSGAVRRLGNEARNFLNDLTEIEEGRFLQIAPNNSGAYKFRQETLPFALALLVVHELKSLPATSAQNPKEMLNALLDPIRGFDIVGDILAAAVGLACLDDTCPPAGRVTLIHLWLGLQNVSADQLSKLSACIPAQPEAFLDALESPEAEAGRTDRQYFLLDRLTEFADHPSVRPAVEARVASWLGCWSRKDPHAVQRQSQGQTPPRDRVADALASLSPTERDVFARFCGELVDSPAVPLDRAAALFMVGGSQCRLASGLFAWALARSIEGRPGRATEDLAWSVRLNPVDFSETEEAVRQLVQSPSREGSAPFRHAAGILLRLLGTRWAAERAEGLLGPERSFSWRHVAQLCDTNPHDPDAPPGSNLDNARSVAANIVPLDLWKLMGSTAEDANLEAATPALARFDPPTIVATLRKIALSIENRSQLPFRQLAWRLPEFSALFDPDIVRVVTSAFNRLVSDPTVLRAEDFQWILTETLRALNPHMEAEEQLQLLLTMPAAVPEYHYLRDALKPLSAQSLEQRLESALTRPNTADLKRVLFFCSAIPANLTDRSREIIASQFNSVDIGLTACASDIAYRTQDPALNALLLQKAHQRTPPPPHQEFYRSRAIAAAVVQQRRGDLWHLLDPQFLGYVAAALGGETLDMLADVFYRVFRRLLERVDVPEPSGVEMIISTSENGLEVVKWAEDTRAQDEEIPFSQLMNDLTSLQDSDQFAEHQRETIKKLCEFENALSREDASGMVMHWSDGLFPMVERNPSRADDCLTAVLNTRDERILGQVYNVAVALAGVYASWNREKAAAVLRHLRPHKPLVRILIGQERISVYDRALFRTPEMSAFDQLRKDSFASALDDSTLETLVAAAETGGAGPWLERYTEQLLQSAHPADIARALTIAGLRHPNDHSDRRLQESWGPGFLGSVAAAAAENYRRARWARHWIQLACSATSPVDFWRFGEIAVGVADWRLGCDLKNFGGSPLWDRFGNELYERLDKAAKKRSDNRRNTLFGLKAPDQRLAKALTRRTKNSS